MVYLTTGLMAILDVVFAVSAVSKVHNALVWRAFVESLRELRLLPARFVASAAVTLTGAEIAIALIGGWALAATARNGRVAPAALPTLVVAGLLLTTLTVGIVLTLRRGTTATCACFGARRRLGPSHVVRNILLLAVVSGGLVGVVMDTSAPAEPAAATLSLVAGALIGFLVTRTDDLVDLFIPHRKTARFPSSRS